MYSAKDHFHPEGNNKCSNPSTSDSQLLNMGNCLKGGPDVTMNCVNSGEIGSCCHGAITPTAPKLNDWAFGGAQGGLATSAPSSFYWSFYPLDVSWQIVGIERENTYAKEAKLERKYFDDFNLCKADGLNEIDRRRITDPVHLLVYERITGSDRSDSYFRVYSNVVNLRPSMNNIMQINRYNYYDFDLINWY